MLEEGRFYCEHLIQSQGLTSVLEVGTGVAVWAIQMALANPQITITSLELNPNRVDIARENIRSMALEDRIRVIRTDARFYEASGLYDLILIDGPKSQNKLLFQRYLKVLSPKGYVVIDNVDFHGEVSSNRSDQSRDLKQLIRKISGFSAWLAEQSDLSVQRIAVGDGLLLVSRKYQR